MQTNRRPLRRVLLSENSNFNFPKLKNLMVKIIYNKNGIRHITLKKWTFETAQKVMDRIVKSAYFEIGFFYIEEL